MMKGSMIRSLVLGSCVVGAVPAVWAADPDSQAAEHKTTTSVSSSAQAPASPTTPAATPPAPQMMTTDGSITALDLKSSMPNLKLTAADGRVWTLMLDPKRTMVWDGSRETQLDQFTQGTAASRLRVGQRVKVSHRLKNGQELAENIQLLQTAKRTPSASTPKTY